MDIVTLFRVDKKLAWIVRFLSKAKDLNIDSLNIDKQCCFKTLMHYSTDFRISFLRGTALVDLGI